jgi:hypothetical protein
MTSHRSLALGCLALIAACSRADTHKIKEQQASQTGITSSESYPIRWSEELKLASRADIDRRLRAIDSEGFGQLSSGQSIVMPQSCVQWSDLHVHGYTPTNTTEQQPDGFARIRCGTLALLRATSVAKRSFVRELVFDERALSALPASIATAMSREEEQKIAAATSAGMSFAAFNPRAAATLNAQTGFFEIDEEPGEPSSILVAPQAWGDFNGDGDDDVALSVINLPGGSAVAYRLLVVTRAAPGAVLRVLSSS